MPKTYTLYFCYEGSTLYIYHVFTPLLSGDFFFVMSDNNTAYLKKWCESSENSDCSLR